VNYQGAASRNRLSKSGPSQLPAGVPNPINEYQAMAGATWEIDLWGRIRRLTESAQAEAAQNAALIGYQAAIQSAFADVDDALASHQELSEQVAAQERLVTAARAYVQLSQTLYDGGREPYSTVLQAEEDLFPAELNLAALRANLYTSMVVIYKAMGGGWVDDAAALTAAAPSNLRIVQ
jgi:outer membrane protein TolC